MICCQKTLAFYTKWTYTAQAHLYSNFSLIIVDVDSLNFVHFLQKNISWYVPRTATQHEIPLMNFEKGFPETIAQYVIWNLIVVQIKGEFKFIELGHAKDTARFIHTICMHRIWWSCEGLTSVHNKYTGYTLKHLLLRYMYNLPLPMLMCYVLKHYALRLPTGGCSLVKCWPTTACWTRVSMCLPTRLCLTLYCVVTYILLV